MNTADHAAYVRAALGLQGYSQNAEFAARITAQFALIARNAGPCLAMPLAASDEPAPLFVPRVPVGTP